MFFFSWLIILLYLGMPQRKNGVFEFKHSIIKKNGVFELRLSI